IVMRLLEKEPDDRYQSAEGLAHDLGRLRDDQAAGRHEPFALGERDFPLRLSAPSRLVGRDAEIGALKAAFDAALVGGSRGVFVAGAPGVGKTALVNGLRSVVTARGGWFVSGKFDQNRQDAESDAAWQAMRALGRLLLAGTEAELAETRVRMASTLGPNINLAAALPEFAALLGVEPGVDPIGGAGGDPGEVATRLQQAGVALLSAIASLQRPVVIVVDDLQWAGAVPVGFIDAVLNADERLAGVLLVGIYREAEVDSTHPLATALARWERLNAAPTVVHLDNLPPTDLGELLGDMLRLPSSEAADLADAVGARTGGNPYDTVELVNALRRDGVLVAGQEGWTWNAATIRRFVGKGDVVALLAARIDRLPGASQALIEIMACLGGDMDSDLVVAASGLAAGVVKKQLVAPLEDGLLVLEQGDPPVVRFRHDRVHQAAYSRLDPVRRRDLHLTVARRLATAHKLGAVAAEQYLQSVDSVQHPDERRVAAGLFVDAAATLRVLNMAAAERYLTAAMALLEAAETAPDDPLLVAAERQRHEVLYSLGRLDDADTVYASIELRSDDPMDLVKAACVQVASLTNRGQPRAAVTLGMALLGRLGMDVPEGDFSAGMEQRGDQMSSWASALVLADELSRPETDNLRVRRASTLIQELLPASFYCEPSITAWLLQASQRLWAEYGPSAPLVANLSSAIVSTIALRNDYRTGYVVAKHVLDIGEARGYEPETSYARHISYVMTRHWFEPLEDSIRPAQLAREGLVRGGNVQMACFTHRTSMAALLDCSPSLESCAADVEPALAFASRTGNDHATGSYLAYRQLIR
ncbi:MAG: ATP-binding protein, partial [Solirubrobacterales bacterium]